MNKILSIAFIAVCIHAFGQNTTEVYSDKSLLFLSEEVSLRNQFLDSIFYQGKIYFTSGKSAGTLMNYNLLDNGISVVDNTKSVLLLDGLDQISFVSYNRRVFFPYQGSFLEQINTYKNDVSLLIKRKTTAIKNSPAYGMSTESESGSKYASSIGIGNQKSYSDLNEEIKIEITMESEYFIKINGRYHSIDRIKDLKKLFPDKKDSILGYISDNHLNINKLGDLKQLIRYCASDAK